MYEIQVIFGEEETSKFVNGTFLGTDEINHVKIYSFNTAIEMHAFIKGMEEAIGWRMCDYITDKREFIKSN